MLNYQPFEIKSHLDLTFGRQEIMHYELCIMNYFITCTFFPSVRAFWPSTITSEPAGTPEIIS